MNPNKALWRKGDFTAIAAFMRESGETVVSGTGIASNLVVAGNKRAAEQGLRRSRFQEGDACNLQGLDDNAFDLTLSVFGAIFAERLENLTEDQQTAVWGSPEFYLADHSVYRGRKETDLFEGLR